MPKSLFGTDGVRGRVGVEPITPQTILKLGWAAGVVLREQQGTQNVFIGKDTRISGYMLESALEAGLSAAGVNITLLGPLPTPGVAHLTRANRDAAGIVISASHNPYYDNGIKIFSEHGTKLGDHFMQHIDEKMLENITSVKSNALGKAQRFPDAAGRYIEHCKSTFDQKSTLKELKIVIDCAHGAGYDVAPRVFSELGANAVIIGNQPDGFNINDHCGSTHPEALVDNVIKLRADAGIALDGDGDRVLMVDSYGNIMDGDMLLYIITKYRKQQGRLGGGVAGTLMTNLGLEQAMAEMEVPFTRTKVGDRYIHEVLTRNQWLVGGEASGHILCLDKTSTGDGIIAALEILEIMIHFNATLDELTTGLTIYPHRMTNVSTGGVSGDTILGNAMVQSCIAKAQRLLGERGRVVLRPSGTEPVFRILIEGEDSELVDKLSASIAEVVDQAGH